MRLLRFVRLSAGRGSALKPSDRGQDLPSCRRSGGHDGDDLVVLSVTPVFAARPGEPESLSRQTCRLPVYAPESPTFALHPEIDKRAESTARALSLREPERWPPSDST